jgi:acyl dehydratase
MGCGSGIGLSSSGKDSLARRIKMAAEVSLQELKEYEGKSLSPSEWFEIDQDRINQFADCTDDHQFIHVDTELAKSTPFGTTIAHGFLSLSLISGHGPSDMPRVKNTVMGINYGLDRVRFLTPVKVNSRVRIHTKILSVNERSPGNIVVKTEKTMEIEGEEKPALVAETLGMMVTAPA